MSGDDLESRYEDLDRTSLRAWSFLGVGAGVGRAVMGLRAQRRHDLEVDAVLAVVDVMRELDLVFITDSSRPIEPPPLFIRLHPEQ